MVEFDGSVPIDAHHPETPIVYLELVACSPDTREHESLVVTEALPSQIHAAMLLAGFEPGRPGSWAWDGRVMTSDPPTGDPLIITLISLDPTGHKIAVPVEDWIINVETGEHFGVGSNKGGWVFAGSRLVTRAGRQWYDADGTGTVVGLTTFGSEVIAWREVISHAEAVEPARWIADADHVPAYGTPVIVRVERADVRGSASP